MKNSPSRTAPKSGVDRGAADAAQGSTVEARSIDGTLWQDPMKEPA
jgi:hypothetical protein